jgi:hypothetical protein
MPWHDMKLSAIPDASHRLWILADHAQGAWALEKARGVLKISCQGAASPDLRTNIFSTVLARCAPQDDSKSAFKCLALIRRGRSAALPLSATSIAKANPVTRDPTHLRATNVGTFPNIVSIEKMRG